MSVPFDTTQELIIVNMSVFGPSGSRELRLALDTAATQTVISRHVLGILGYSVAAAPTVPIIMGGGRVLVPLVIVDKLESLNQTQLSVSVQAHTLPRALPFDGLLGLDYIRGQRLVVDYRTGQIELS